jgi:hypothetical protein
MCGVIDSFGPCHSRADQKALVFFGAVAVLGAGVRVVRAAGGPAQASSQPALDRQIRSIRLRAPIVPIREKENGTVDERAKTPHERRRRRRRTPVAAEGPPPWARWTAEAIVGNRLDMDIASAAQIDSRTGRDGPLMAKRIVTDRMARGPVHDLRTGLATSDRGGRQRLSQAHRHLINFSAP